MYPRVAIIVCERIQFLHPCGPSSIPVDADGGRANIGHKFYAFAVLERDFFSYEDFAQAVGVRGDVAEVGVAAEKGDWVFA